LFRFALAATFAALPIAGQAAPAAAPAPVSVMIVGNFHMSNPGRDIHNLTVDDMLSPKRQAEIAAVTDALNRFHPTAVAAEWPADIASERYAKYLAGTLDPSRNEVVQLGFRLARTAGLKDFHGVDVDGDFPYEPLDAYARAHGQGAILDQAQAEVGADMKAQDEMLKTSSVAANLRHMNDPSLIARSNGFYRTTLRIGGGATQPGADLLTAWYRRNFLICANIIQLSKPGDRIVVFYGAGHSFLLRQCVQETPGFELVEPNAFLPG
jgi:uncharacterized protein DUF5694